MSTIYQEFNVELEKTTFEDNNSPAIILKTHNYRGEPTEDNVAKSFGKINDHKNINRKIFTPFHINIINSETRQIIGSSKNNTIHSSFINLFCLQYNNNVKVSTIKVLISTTTFRPLENDGKLIIKLIKTYYSIDEVKQLFIDMSKELDINQYYNKKIQEWQYNNL